MTPLIYIGLGLAVAVLGAYTMAMQGATQHWGVRLVGGPTEEDLVRQRLAQGASLAEAKGYALGATVDFPRYPGCNHTQVADGA